MDLARFMFPYWFLPKRWRSTLFEHNAGKPTKTVCSTMMAEAFARVRFPLIPVICQDKEGNLSLVQSNSKLLTPRDFDHSPYFDVIKYPLLEFDELGIYRKLPWDQTSVHCTTIGDCFYTNPDELELLKSVNSADTIQADKIKELLSKENNSQFEQDMQDNKAAN
jgi:hypothetical protein